MELKKNTLEIRKKFKGLIGIKSKIEVRDSSILSLVYTPGVAECCRRIEKDGVESFKLTCRGNTIGIISDGSSVFGLGDVGPYASVPMLEGYSVFFKTFANIDALPLAVNVRCEESLIEDIRRLEPTFGGFYLEDIASPNCFVVENMLRRCLSVPVIHGDQHSTAMVVLAGLINSLKITGKKKDKIKVVINGAGAAGIGVAKLLFNYGIKKILLCDKSGIIYKNRPYNMNWAKSEIAKYINEKEEKGSLTDALKDADVFIGVSVGGALEHSMIKLMNKEPVIFALASPEPEINYLDAKKAGARIVATSRIDFPNYFSSAIIIPGFVRGVLDVGAKEINPKLKIAASESLAGLVKENINETNILPDLFDFRIAPIIAGAVAKEAVKLKINKIDVSPENISERLFNFLYEGTTENKDMKFKLLEHGDVYKESVLLHKKHTGIIEVNNKVPIKDRYLFNVVYSPKNVSEACNIIYKNKELIYDYTCKSNLVAVVSDGSAVLGLGNIGARAAMPVMEGKALLFKTFGGVEAFPICINTQEPDEIIRVVESISVNFGGINLEDISAPRCFYVENQLKKKLDIPVFHDDQHGTAVIVLAGLKNALKIVNKKIENVKIVVNGAGAGATAVSKLIIKAGAKNLIMCDTKGAIFQGRTLGMNAMKEEMSRITNPNKEKGSVHEVLKGADVFIGLSKGNLLVKDDIKKMNKDAIVFGLANPTPEILPDEAKAGGARIVATGRSDFPNQVNNCLAFPGIFRGALDVRAKEINDNMKLAAAYAISSLAEKSLSPDYILPDGLNLKVPVKVASAVAKTAMETGVARLKINIEDIEMKLQEFLYEKGLLEY